jgi:hypothetical protein
MVRNVTITLAALAALAWMAGAAAAQPFDHLHCFKVKDAAPKATYTLDVEASDAAFAVPPGCRVKARASLLCVGARTSNVVPLPPGAAPGLPAQTSLCYKLKCAKVQPTATLEDQFGSHVISVKSSNLLCVPATPPAPPCTDVDGDGFCAEVDDCDDASAAVNPAAAEQCNGLDDDCSGAADEGDPGGGQPCGSNVGACAPGVSTCQAGALVCVGGVEPAAEQCDGVDNDCDGLTDESDPSLGMPCDGADEDQCAEGQLACTAGALTCTDNTGTSVEVCDNSIDDDCDGTTDEGC